jgi:hypothetical protein
LGIYAVDVVVVVVAKRSIFYKTSLKLVFNLLVVAVVVVVLVDEVDDVDVTDVVVVRT